MDTTETTSTAQSSDYATTAEETSIAKIPQSKPIGIATKAQTNPAETAGSNGAATASHRAFLRLDEDGLRRLRRHHLQ